MLPIDRRLRSLLLALCGIGLWALCSQAADTPSAASLQKEFASPGPEFRGKPFWSWNGELDEAELKRQIDVLQGMGMGGFFMHSRTGLQTEYLGPEWFRLINACADAGERLGLEGYLYDEDRWPSGTAGGRVTENPRFQMKYLKMVAVPAAEFQWPAESVAVFAVDLKETSYHDCLRLSRETPPASYAGKTVLVFSVEAMPRGSFYNGFTYADTLNREATDEFLKLTHEQYKAQCGDRLGRSIRAIFTDEPHRGALFGGFGLDTPERFQMVPWTARVPEEFQKRFGYDLVERLPELFLRKDGQAVAQVKWHFVELLQAMFLENWARPIHAWCQKNRLAFTGHVLHEDSLSCQVAMQGSLMRFYECMDWPGVDVLGEGNRCYWIVKQLASVARQLGQKQLLSELYGCTGWQFNFESHKYVGDWQALFGINLRCHHLSWYTMGGEAKRDYPASIFYQSAWWKDYPYVEDYYARLNLMLAQGEPACDVLVLNPIESVWCQVGVGWAEHLSPKTKEVQALETAYTQLFHWLAGSQIDFDYGDEEMLGRLTAIERDASGQAVFRVGRAPYRVVVVPKMTTIRATTLKLLEAFRQAGGKVVVAGEPPAYVDAVASPEAAQLAQQARQVAWDRAALVAACRESLRQPVEIGTADGQPLEAIFCQMRTSDDRRVLVAMNMDRKQSFENVKLRAKVPGHLTEWDCRTGTRFAVPAVTTNGWTEWTADFAPIGEHVYVLSDAPEPGLTAKAPFQESRQQVVAGPLEYRLGEPNVCVLDLAQYRLNDGTWEPEREILKVDQAVRGAVGLPLRGGEMVQPWFRKKLGTSSEVKGTVALRFQFQVEEVPQQPVLLGIEQPEKFQISLNETPLPSGSAEGWWVDPAIRTIPVPASALHHGTNTVELTTQFRDDVDLEALYLLGTFGVRLQGTEKTLTKLPETVTPSDLVEQGFPFYSGPITYRIPVKAEGDATRLVVETPQFEAACIKVSSGASPSRLIAWQPYRTEIPVSEIRDGVLELEVVLTRRNSFGPLHQLPKKASGYGPESWITEGRSWSDAYQLYPSGLLAAPVVHLGRTP